MEKHDTDFDEDMGYPMNLDDREADRVMVGCLAGLYMFVVICALAIIYSALKIFNVI